MLRDLLRDCESAKGFLEKAGLFKDPKLLEKYAIASEVTLEVLDAFLARVFGTDRESMCDGACDLKVLCE